MLTNYHSHTHFSDGKFSPELYLSQAIQKGFTAYGFSDHAPFPGVNHFFSEANALENYINNIADLRALYEGRIEIYTSLEIDYFKGRISPSDEKFTRLDLDYTIGSVHFLENPLTGQPWGIEGPVENFLLGYEKIFARDIRFLIETYYSRMREMILSCQPTIIGHIDRVKRHNFSLQLFSEDESWYRKMVLETLDALASTACIMEVNTKGYYSIQNGDLYPSPWILQEACKRNIPVHVSSDTHHPRYVDGGFAHAKQVILEAGYQTQRLMLAGQWQDVAVSEAALIY